jgi:hypothetical protein
VPPRAEIAGGRIFSDRLSSSRSLECASAGWKGSAETDADIGRTLAGCSNFGVDSIHCSAGKVFMRSVLRAVAWLCLLLMLVSAYVFAVHQHSSALDEAQCTVCVIAHSASPAAVCILPSAFLILVLLLVVAEPLSTKQRLVPFALSVRPPPAV